MSIVDFAANLIVERHGGIEAVGRHRGTETTRSLGQQRAGGITAGLVPVSGGGILQLAGVAGALAFRHCGIHIVEGLALVVDACILHEEGIVERSAHSIPAVVAGSVVHIAAVVHGLLCGQLKNLRGVVGYRPCDGPVDVVGANGVHREGELKTTVAHVADVAVVATCTHRLRQRYPEEHVAYLLVIDVKGAAHQVVQNAEFHTHIEVGRCLPGQVGVAEQSEGGRHLRVAGLRERVEVGVIIAAHVVVALLTDGELELEIVHPVHLEPRLLVHGPCGAHRPEVAPPLAVFLGKTA